MFKHLKASMFVMYLVYLALGLALLAWPDMSAQLLCYACGGALLAAGLIAIWRYATREAKWFYAYFTLVYGLLFSVVGIFLLVKPGLVLTILPLVFGVFVLFDSVGRVQNALELRRAGWPHWWALLLFALLSVVLGAVIIADPFAAQRLLLQVIGGILLVEAVLGLACALYTNTMLRTLEKQAEQMARQLEQLGDALEADAVGDMPREADIDAPGADED